MLTKQQWHGLWRRIRKSGRKDSWIGQQEDYLVKRQRFADAIRQFAVNDEVALNFDQMDCDCSQWYSSTIVSAKAPFAVSREVDRVYENAEGPVRWWLSKPEDAVEYSSRDLALEAFEDGHPHVVYR